MALTSGAKKFLGLLLTVAVVGGAIYGYKQYKAGQPPAPVAVEQVVEAPVQEAPTSIPQPINSPMAQAERLQEVVQPAEPAPEPAPAQANPGHNRGLSNIMKQAGTK
jgi:hypothetical protein